MLKEDVARARRQLEDLEAAAASTTADTDDGDDKKYELLVKRDQDMQQFIDKFDEVCMKCDNVLRPMRTSFCGVWYVCLDTRRALSNS